MEAVFFTIIALGGIGAALWERIPLDIIEVLCVAFASMSAGAYVIVRVLDGEQNYQAAFYCIVAILSGMIYHAFKIFYDVTPQRVRK